MASQEPAKVEIDPFASSTPQSSFGVDSFHPSHGHAAFDPFSTPQNSFGQATPQNSFGADSFDPFKGPNSFDPFTSFDVGTAPGHVQAMFDAQEDEDDVPWVPLKAEKAPKMRLEPMAEEEEDAAEEPKLVPPGELAVEVNDDVAKIAYIGAGHSEGDYRSIVDEKEELQSENSRLALENAILMQHCMAAAQSAAASSRMVAESMKMFPGAWGEVAPAGSPWGEVCGLTYPYPARSSSKGRKDRKKPGPKAKSPQRAPKWKQPVAEVPPEEQTTVVLRNTPTVYTRTSVLKLLDASGFANLYDFVYVPFDFKFHKSVGFAFVNMTKPEDARDFMQKFEGFTDWEVEGEWKAATVNWASPHQGLDAHVEKFKNSPVMHESVPDEQRPAIFRDGQRVDFPQPTESIRPPRTRPGHVTGRRAQVME